MKIGIVGYGYWGKIILSNLVTLGYTEIVVCDNSDVDISQLPSNVEFKNSYLNLDCDKVFVVTPLETHYEVCKHFLNRGISVFCEKPLCNNSSDCEKLFNIAKENNTNLFVDWLFLYNPAIKKIKDFINENGKPISIQMNRLNFGPVRFDTNAKWDLASHDVSILSFLLKSQPNKITWNSHRLNKNSIQEDSCVGVIEFPECYAILYSSWCFPQKNRMCIFEFKEGIMIWDDFKKTLEFNSERILFDEISPLHESINAFLNDEIPNETTTINITRILEHEG